MAARSSVRPRKTGSAGRVAGGVTAGLVPTAVAALNMALNPAAPTTVRTIAGTTPTVICGVHCGTERWPVKTMSDPNALSVALTPLPKSVHELVNNAAPTTAPISDEERGGGVERQTFSVTATLFGYKIESGATGDQDFHIVIQDPKTQETMIVEIPDPQCAGVCNSTQMQAIQNARKVLSDAFPDNPPTPRFAVVDDPKPQVTVIGVGLYDFFHGQTGVATNCVELHPVLDIKFQGPGTFKSAFKSTPELKTVESDHQCIPKAK